MAGVIINLHKIYTVMGEIIFIKKGLDVYLKESLIKDFDDVVNVINIDHGTDANTKYIRQWEAYKSRKLKGCANLNCDNHKKHDALVGGHVKIKGSNDNRWYITPLCHSCNAQDGLEMVVYKEDLALYTEIKDLPVE